MTRLDLPKGQWIDVRDRLNNGHTEDRIGLAAQGVSSDGSNFNWHMGKYRTATAAIFIVRWSDGIVDEQGKPLAWAAGQSFKYRCAIALKVDANLFAVIVAKMYAHEAAIQNEWVAEGNEIPADVSA